MGWKNLLKKTISKHFLFTSHILKTTKLEYRFIALNMQKCSGLEMQTETSWFHKYSKRRKVLILEFHKKIA